MLPFLFTVFVASSLLVTVDATPAGEQLPTLNIDGFAWAENLAFDGLGNVFVSENTRGELWKISLCTNGTAYSSDMVLTDGVKKFGGLQVAPDGKTLVIGATMDDGSTAVLSTSTQDSGYESKEKSYEVVAQTIAQPNGLAADWERKMLYYTFEGTADSIGSLMGIDLQTGKETQLAKIPFADGCWYEPSQSLLYVGIMTSLKIKVYSTDVPTTSDDKLVFIGEYPALSEALADGTHFLDDLTVYHDDDSSSNAAKSAKEEDVANTKMLGADFMGKMLHVFYLNGTLVESFDALPASSSSSSSSFHQITSVRWGQGPGFDASSVYITEGGGMAAALTNRRVMQLRMDA